MKSHTRRAIAYIAGRLVSKADTSNIYDNTEGQNYSYTGNVSKKGVSIYDHAQQCEIKGTPRNLFHHGNSKYINLSVCGNNFRGYDSDSNSDFQGNVEARSVRIFDPEDKRYYSYWV
ncbi:MAG: hypothetical protein DMG65_24505 [Candidatus Angelobacter sp. Gp1-AA117]|nr:MAG: hypothetical protein DMG65_24505 [Candidatus Angelobacter sp. Gp1-AA117]